MSKKKAINRKNCTVFCGPTFYDSLVSDLIPNCSVWDEIEARTKVAYSPEV